MELALYGRAGGYYSARSRVGGNGDFYTGPVAHPVFGTLICLQLYQMWGNLGCPNPFWAVEVGSGNGVLSSDVLSCAPQLGSRFLESLRYVCLDRYPTVIGLQDFEDIKSPTGIISTDGIPLKGVVGCILSNELLDSFPVHKLTMDGGVLKEVYVTVREGKYVELLDLPSTPLLEDRLRRVGIVPAEGSCLEVNLVMETWLEAVATSLERGYVLTIDYGDLSKELYSASNRRGTLVTYRNHVQRDDPYSHIGEQDITSKVDFTALMEVGQSHGLEALGFTTQRQFFNNLGLQSLIRKLSQTGLTQREIEANMMGMLDIAKPGGMGDFKVLIQGNDISDEEIWGIESSREVEKLTEILVTPLLTKRHTPLLEGSYPYNLNMF